MPKRRTATEERRPRPWELTHDEFDAATYRGPFRTTWKNRLKIGTGMFPDAVIQAGINRKDETAISIFGQYIPTYVNIWRPVSEGERGILTPGDVVCLDEQEARALSPSGEAEIHGVIGRNLARNMWPSELIYAPPRVGDLRDQVGLHEAMVRYAIKEKLPIPARVLAEYPEYVYGPKLTRMQRLCTGRGLYLRDRIEHLNEYIREEKVLSYRRMRLWDGERSGWRSTVAESVGEIPFGFVLTVDPYSSTDDHYVVNEFSTPMDKVCRGNELDREVRLDVWVKRSVDPWHHRRLDISMRRFMGGGVWDLLDIAKVRPLRDFTPVPRRREQSEAFLPVVLPESLDLLSFCDVSSWTGECPTENPSWWPDLVKWLSQPGVRFIHKEWKSLIDVSDERSIWIDGDRISHEMRYAALVRVAAVWAQLRGMDGIVIPPDEVWIFRSSKIRLSGRRRPEAKPPLLYTRVQDLISLDMEINDDVLTEAMCKRPDSAAVRMAWERVEKVWGGFLAIIDTLTLQDMTVRQQVRAGVELLTVFRLLLGSLGVLGRSTGSLYGRVYLTASRDFPLPGPGARNRARNPEMADWTDEEADLSMTWGEIARLPNGLPRSMGPVRWLLKEEVTPELEKIAAVISAGSIDKDEFVVHDSLRKLETDLANLMLTQEIRWPLGADAMVTTFSRAWGV